MNIQNISISLSGTGLDLVGSKTTASLCLLLAMSGNMCIPVQCDDAGILQVS